MKLLHLLTITTLALVACDGSKKQNRDDVPKAADKPTETQQLAGKQLVDLVSTHVTDHVEDPPDVEFISAMAAIIGERCIIAAGEYKPTEHDFSPGQRIFSDQINLLLAGPVSVESVDDTPVDSVYATLHREIERQTGSSVSFPTLAEIFGIFASGIGDPEGWGTVPLSVSPSQSPTLKPIRITFATRDAVDKILAQTGDDPQEHLKPCLIALATLIARQPETDLNSAIAVAAETINGMGKTAPLITDIETPSEEMKAAQREVIKIGPPPG